MIRKIAVVLLLVAATPALAAFSVKFDFNTQWDSDYAPGWENTAYRHGEAPVGKMMDYVSGGKEGGGMRLIADSTPESWMWWAAVNPIDVAADKMLKQYDPYVSVQYYDDMWATEQSNLHRTGQLYAVPSWVNPYLSGGEDWTDIQFGPRYNQAPPNDNYYYVAAGESSPGWQDTNVDRTPGWHELKMQLLNSDGRVHFYLDGVEVGATYRNDYTDLGGVGLYTMFTAPLSEWTANKPGTVWDNFEFGSSYVPAPGAALVGVVGLGLIGWFRRRIA